MQHAPKQLHNMYSTADTIIIIIMMQLYDNNGSAAYICTKATTYVQLLIYAQKQLHTYKYSTANTIIIIIMMQLYDNWLCCLYISIDISMNDARHGQWPSPRSMQFQ